MSPAGKIIRELQGIAHTPSRRHIRGAEVNLAADQAAPAKDRQTAQKRAEEAKAALDRLQSEQQQAEYVLKDMDQRQEQLRSAYQAALDRLLERIRQMPKTAGEA